MKNAPTGAFIAPGVGFEPTTNWLTANCATAALPGNKFLQSLVFFLVFVKLGMGVAK